MLFLVSNDGEDEYIRISPYIARLVMSGFRKELSYWLYKLKVLNKWFPKKPTTEDLARQTELENKVRFYSAQVDYLQTRIDNCEYQKSKCK